MDKPRRVFMLQALGLCAIPASIPLVSVKTGKSKEVNEMIDLTFGQTDMIIEVWSKSLDLYLAKIYKGGILHEYMDDKRVPIGTHEKLLPDFKIIGSHNDRGTHIVLIAIDQVKEEFEITYSAHVGYEKNDPNRNPRQEFKRFQNDYLAMHGKFPDSGFSVNRTQPQSSKLLDWMLIKHRHGLAA